MQHIEYTKEIEKLLKDRLRKIKSEFLNTTYQDQKWVDLLDELTQVQNMEKNIKEIKRYLNV